MNPDVERQVWAYAEFLDSTLPVLEAEDAMVERIGTPPVWPIQERRIRRAVPGWVWAAAAAAATIIVGGVLGLILARPSDQPADVIQPAPTTVPATPTTTSPPTTVPGSTTLPPPPASSSVPATTVPSGFPDESVVIGPAAADPFSVGSVVGTWTWAPADVWNEFPPLPDAFIDGLYLANSGNLAAQDGLDWSSLFGPTRAHGLTTGGSSLYASSHGQDAGRGLGLSLWRYESGSWIEVRLPDAFDVEIEGLTLAPSLIVELAGSSVLVSLEDEVLGWYFDLFHSDDSPFASYYGQDAVSPEYDRAQDVLVIPHHDFGETGEIVATVTVEIVADRTPRIEFRDTATGDVVHTVAADVPGLTPAEVREAILARDLESLIGVDPDTVFISTDGGAFQEIGLPSPIAGGRFGERRQIASLNGDLLALLEDGELWRSPDGRSWTQIEPSGVDLSPDAMLLGGNDRIFLVADRAWTSTDGETWEVSDGLFDEGSLRIDRAPFGWMAVEGGPFGSPVTLLVSPDGLGWQTVDAPGDLCWAEFAGETIFGVSCNEDRTLFTRWTARLDTAD